jgi:hypothetical protein
MVPKETNHEIQGNEFSISCILCLSWLNKKIKKGK